MKHKALKDKLIEAAKKILPKSIFVSIVKFTPRKALAVEINIVEHCNLNCKCCGHYSCIAEEEFLSPAAFEKDIARLALLTNNLYHLKLLGGEPLLHPNLLDFFDIARKHFPDSLIEFATNGILLLKQPETFWNSCKKNNIEIVVTKYPIKLDFTAMEELSRSKGVVYRYFFPDMEPVKTMFKVPLLRNATGDVKKNFVRCIFSNGGCTTLRDGKIYQCCTTAHLKHFTKRFGEILPITERDFIDIYKVKSIKEIQKFLSRPVPFCAHCDIQNIITDIEWGITKKEISEWI
jgi:MoaA/NifB/PqqE/SkfB family radical SAM enzyme